MLACPPRSVIVNRSVGARLSKRMIFTIGVTLLHGFSGADVTCHTEKPVADLAGSNRTWREGRVAGPMAIVASDSAVR